MFRFAPVSGLPGLATWIAPMRDSVYYVDNTDGAMGMTEIDLDAAVSAGILDAPTRDRLLVFTGEQSAAAGPDEESFRLLTGFNDIFVTIAIGLVLFALGTLGGRIAPALGAALVAAASWGLAEYFTRTRRMALPSIALLLAFVGGVFFFGVTLFGADSIDGRTMVDSHSAAAPGFAVAAAMAAVAAFAHWRRFMVPITVAAGAAAVAGLVLALASVVAIIAPEALLVLTLLAGLAVFALAMTFDMRDRARVTRWSDVAFWLHLLAAPMIIHPVFTLTGLTGGAPSTGAAVAVIVIYAFLTAVALAIDRRALLVSALVYVIYATQAIVTSGRGVTESYGLTALVIGGFLVLLSAAWRPIRARVLGALPLGMTAKLPVAA